MRSVAVILLFMLGVMACDNTVTVALTTQERLVADVAIIDKYLDDNRIIAQKDSTGLRMVIRERGTGPVPNKDNCLNVDYELWILYESTSLESGTGYSIPLKKSVLGWQLAMKQLQTGSKVTLYLPSGLAYGPSGTPDGRIPANTILKFDVTLNRLSNYNALGEYCY